MHQADAGDVDWFFTIPQPTITYIPPPVHTVDAGDVGWTFIIPQPTVTYVPPPMHRVDAGDVAWSFAVLQPTVTYTAPPMHTVDAGDVSWIFAVPRPTVTYTPPTLDHTVNAGDVGWSFNVRRPTISYFAPVTTFFLLVDWAGDGSFSHPDSDVSRDVVADIDCTRGRGDYGSQLFGRSEAGILRTRLRNDEGKYDVLNVQSSLGDLITTRRMVRLSMAYPNIAETTLWTGYLDKISGKERRGGRDTVDLLALGPLALLGDARPVIPAGQNESIGSIMGRLIEASIPGLDNSLVESTRTIPRWVKPAEETALVSARQLEETEFGLFRERPDARFVLEGRNHRLTASARPA